jgi:hypothetical protein
VRALGLGLALLLALPAEAANWVGQGGTVITSTDQASGGWFQWAPADGLVSPVLQVNTATECVWNPDTTVPAASITGSNVTLQMHRCATGAGTVMNVCNALPYLNAVAGGVTPNALFTMGDGLWAAEPSGSCANCILRCDIQGK